MSNLNPDQFGGVPFGGLPYGSWTNGPWAKTPDVDPTPLELAWDAGDMHQHEWNESEVPRNGRAGEGISLREDGVPEEGDLANAFDRENNDLYSPGRWN